MPGLHSHSVLDFLGLIQWKLFGITENVINCIVLAIMRFNGQESAINQTLSQTLSEQSSPGQAEPYQPNPLESRGHRTEFSILDELRRYLKSYGPPPFKSLPFSLSPWSKFAAFVAILFWVFIFLLILPVGLFALVLRIFLHQFRNEFLLVHSGRTLDFQAEGSLRLKTWNIALTEMNTMNSVNLLPSSESRLSAILSETLKDKPDIFCWQEAFHPFLIAHVVVPALVQQGYSVVYASRYRNVLSMNSGTLIASRYEISDVGFAPFLGPTRLNRFANKGVLMARICLSNSLRKDIVVAGTHCLCAEHFPEGEDRSRYLFQVYDRHLNYARKQIEIFVQQCGERVCDVVFMGDFNVSRLDGSIGRAIVNIPYDFATLEQLTSIKDGISYKDLTVPDVNLPTSVTSARSSDFVSSVEHNESGSERGSSVYTEAFSFR